ncbi:hypothetical protein GQ457_13G017170 [Hibiscus cannabinus]
MVTLFHDMMRKEVEVYEDDMIAKCRTEDEHIVNLEKLFQRLRKFRLRLNPAKCTFGVTSKKLLGFVVSKRGIEIDPDKVKAVQEFPSPQTQKEVQGFLGRLNYIAHFIFQMTEKCDPVFRLLRKNNLGTWDEECQVLLRCVNVKEAQMILEEVHEGVYGTHPSGFTMPRKIMRFGYFWSTMERDCIDYARMCHKCQIYADKIHVLLQPLHVMNCPWPFSMWGMDVIGKIQSKASNGHQFILVAIDYFTKMG